MAKLPISETDRTFLETYMASGNGEEALRTAFPTGHSKSRYPGAIMRRPEMQAAMAERVAEMQDDPLIATRVERQRWWTAIMRDPDAELAIRIRASELLAKSQGDFIVKVEAKIEHTNDPREELEEKLAAIKRRSTPVPPLDS
jgi:phage terminase small subunit